MLEGIRHCPACGSRVLPTADDLCPTCRQYTFTGRAEESAAAAPDAATVRATADGLYRGAMLHWRLLKWFGALIALLFVRLGVRLLGRDGLTERGLDPDLVHTLVPFALAAAGLSMWATARKLADWLRLMNPRAGAPLFLNVFSLLKHSMTYFESKGVPVGFLGPRLSKMEAPEDDAAW